MRSKISKYIEDKNNNNEKVLSVFLTAGFPRKNSFTELALNVLDAGADITETDSFGATSVVLAEYQLAQEARRLNRLAAEIARREAEAASTPEKPRFVAGSMGPTTKTISVTGGITF
ncbi:MAG: homocysteine S-methyltransferase family protein, partial [Bacteroidetes bacterium]|nr:homocysteine S-methyltransferase family protein [Bacteroidota bacterium]